MDNMKKSTPPEPVETPPALVSTPPPSPKGQQPGKTPAQADPSYTMRMWKGIKPTYVCDRCETSRDSLDDIIEHVIRHVPQAQQESLLTKLLARAERGNNG